MKDAPPALRVVSLVAGLAMECWLLWMILPPQVKIEIVAEVRAEWERARGIRERRKVRKGLEFEAWLLEGYLNDYNHSRDAKRLASDLAA